MNLEIIKGQTSATVDYVHESLKPYPVFAVCTNSNCRFIGPTKVNKTMNVLNCLFCYFFVGCWFVFNQLKGVFMLRFRSSLFKMWYKNWELRILLKLVYSFDLKI